MAPPPESDRKRSLFLFGGLALVAAVAAALALRSPQPQAKPTVLSPMPARPEAALASADIEGDRLFTRQVGDDTPTGLDGDLSFAQLMGAVRDGAKAKPELAKKIVDEFKAQPKLMEVYENFEARANDGQRPGALEFMGALRRRGFSELAGRFMQAPGSASLLLSIAKRPEMREFLRKDAEAVTAKLRAKSGGARGAASSGGRLASGGGPGGARSALAGDSMRGGAAAAGSRGAQAASSAGAAGGGGHVGGSGALAPGGGGQLQAGGGGQTVAPGGLGNPGGGGGAPGGTTPLGEIEDPVTVRMRKLLEMYPWLKELGDENLRKLITTDVVDRYGLWGACFQMEIFGRCHAACMKAGCAEVGGWKACMDVFADDLECLKRCPKQEPCVCDGLAWNKRCVPPPTTVSKNWTQPGYCGENPWGKAKTGCTGSLEVCMLYQTYLSRPPEKAGALGWETEVQRLKKEGKTSQQILAALGPQFQDSLEARLQANDATVRQGELEDHNRAYQEFIKQKGIENAGGACLDAVKCNTTADQALVSWLYTSLLNREPDPAGMAAWLAQVQGGLSAEEAVKKFKDSEEYKKLHPGP